MNQEISFDTSSGIDLKGWWSNPSTGESYQVVDQFFQDNSLYVKTLQGQIINFNRIQNFVHSDKPFDKPVDRVKLQKQNSKLLEGLAQDDPNILPEDLEMITGRKQNSVPVREQAPEKSVDTIILDKMFSKAPAPTVTLTIKWDWDKLRSTLDILKDTMDVSIEEICDYVYKKYCEEIQSEVKLRIESELFGVAVPSQC